MHPLHSRRTAQEEIMLLSEKTTPVTTAHLKKIIVEERTVL